MDAQGRWIPTPISWGFRDCPPGPYPRFLPEQGNPRSAYVMPAMLWGNFSKQHSRLGMEKLCMAHPEALLRWLQHLTDDNVELSDKAPNENPLSEAILAPCEAEGFFSHPFLCPPGVESYDLVLGFTAFSPPMAQTVWQQNTPSMSVHPWRKWGPRIGKIISVVIELFIENKKSIRAPCLKRINSNNIARKTTSPEHTCLVFLSIHTCIITQLPQHIYRPPLFTCDQKHFPRQHTQSQKSAALLWRAKESYINEPKKIYARVLRHVWCARDLPPHQILLHCGVHKSHDARINEPKIHGTRVDKLGHTCEWVALYMSVRHAAHVNGKHSKEPCLHSKEPYVHSKEPCIYSQESHIYHVRWVMLHMKMIHATHVNKSYDNSEWIVSYIWMNLITHVSEPCHTYEWVVSQIRMSRVTNMNESCHKYEWVVSQIWMSHVIHLNEPCNTYEWVMSHTNESYHQYEWAMSQMWMSPVTHMNESCNTYEWVMSYMRMNHVTKIASTQENMNRATHMNESCHTYEWGMSHIWTSPVTHTNESCHTYERVLSHIWTSPATHMNESCYTYEWVLSHVWMSHVKHTNESCHTYEWVMSHIRTSPDTHMNESCHTSQVGQRQSCAHASRLAVGLLSRREGASKCSEILSHRVIFFCWFWIHTASAPSTAETSTSRGTELGKPRGSPARRHCHSSCHMFVWIVVCACSRHALDFKMLFLRSFVKRKRYCLTISRRSESKLLRESLEFTEDRLWTNNASVLFERQN